MQKKVKLAVVEDDLDLQELLHAFFHPKGYEIHSYDDPTSLLNDLEKKKNQYDVIITDLNLPNISGLELTKELKRLSVATPVILMTAYKSIGFAVEAIEAGAYDFIVKPIFFPQLLVSVERAIYLNRIYTENQTLKSVVAINSGVESSIIGRSPGILRAIELAKRVANSTANVFVTGETGTGKEVIAKCIHNASDRRNGPFLAINCSAIPENLLESELFGHTKGAFTGANEKKIGLFEEAEGGTVFLDEIGDLKLPLQSKLLRVLQEKKVKRIGENQHRSFNARIISATHKNLKKDIEEKKFREDLYFRLNVIPIHLPPLRDRKEDILPLADFFIRKYCALYGQELKRMNKSCFDYLLNNPWRGNIRELENTIERVIVLSEGPVIDLPEIIQDELLHIGYPASSDHAPHYETIANATESDETATKINSQYEKDFLEKGREAEQDNLKKWETIFSDSSDKNNPLLTLDSLTKKYILFALKKNEGAKDKTAKDLAIDRKTLYRRIREIELEQKGNFT